MRQIVFQSNEQQGIGILSNASIPILKKNQTYIKVKVSFASINPVDAKFLFGDKLPQFFLPFVKYCVNNSVVGFDYSGKVDESYNKDFKKGDRVFGTMMPFYGSFAEYIIAPVNQLAKIPENVSLEQAAALPLVGLTAYQSLVRDSKIQRGQRILILGASGGTGHVACQIAKATGLTVTGVCGTSNIAFVKNLGVDNVLDYKSDIEIIDQISKIALDQGPFHYCLDCVSSHDKRDTGFQYEQKIMSNPNLLIGQYITLGGFFLDWIKAGFDKVTGSTYFARQNKRLFWIQFPNSAGDLKEVGKLAAEGKLKVYIEKIYDLNDVKEAFKNVMSRRVVGKLVINFSA